MSRMRTHTCMAISGSDGAHAVAFAWRLWPTLQHRQLVCLTREAATDTRVAAQSVPECVNDKRQARACNHVLPP